MCNKPFFLLDIPKWYLRKRFYVLPFTLKRLLNNIYYDKQGVSHYRMFMSFDSYEQYKLFFDNFNLSQFVYRLPCGKCLGCKADRKNQWTMRCIIESREFTNNSFITLTYNEDNVPPTLIRKHYQDFMKRLREKFARLGLPSPRQYYRGEYGDKGGRPHYHAILFNCDFPDKEVLYWLTKHGKKVRHACPGAVPYYASKLLASLWPYGYHVIAPVTVESIKYVANYLDKGYNDRIDPVTGLVQTRPFNGWSSRPALARSYFDRNYLFEPEKLYNVSVPGVPARGLRYYRRLLKDGFMFEEDFVELQARQRAIAEAQPRPWERTSLTEQQYLMQREERMRAAIDKFCKHSISLSFNPFIESRFIE